MNILQLALTLAAVMLAGVFIGCRLCKMNKEEDEALNRPSEAKREQKDLPMFLRKQAGAKWK